MTKYEEIERMSIRLIFNKLLLEKERAEYQERLAELYKGKDDK